MHDETGNTLEFYDLQEEVKRLSERTQHLHSLNMQYETQIRKLETEILEMKFKASGRYNHGDTVFERANPKTIIDIYLASIAPENE